MKIKSVLMILTLTGLLIFAGCAGKKSQSTIDSDVLDGKETEAVDPEAADKADKAEADKAEADKAEADKAEADKAEADKAEADKAEADKAEADKAEADKAEADKAETAEPEATAKEDAWEETVDIDNVSSTEFAALMKMGWNLGNTLDANTVGGLESENCWGQPTTTKELVQYVKSEGFTSIRIPISWGKHTDENYTIDPQWMARVKEVVDYAYDEGMFVIINSHHDNDYYYPSEENMENATRYISTVWAQIAEEFKDYDNHLVFESMNEPRLAGTGIEWWFNAGDAKGEAAIKRICSLNQTFVDTVRTSGGNNENRFLMVPSYAASQDFALNKSFSMPEDPANRIMLSVHAYTPYDFAGSASGYKEWDGSKTTEFNFMGKLMSKFIHEGYGVVIGEFGATNKDNPEDRERWARGYTMKASSLGISYFIWDNGAVGVGEENFGLIDRNNLQVYFPSLLDAYKCGYPD